MKYLCLAYGAEEDWHDLTAEEQNALLAQDQVLLERGDLVEALGTSTTVRAWTGEAETTVGPFAQSSAPLAGFSLIEADSLEEAIGLISGTPCARARGAVEVRQVLDLR